LLSGQLTAAGAGRSPKVKGKATPNTGQRYKSAASLAAAYEEGRLAGEAAALHAASQAAATAAGLMRLLPQQVYAAVFTDVFVANRTIGVWHDATANGA
jgi:hypothetical protein